MGVQRDAGNSVFGFVLSVFRRATATGGTARLPRVVGKSIAKELIFTGGKVSGKDAMSIGFVNYCVPAGEAYAKALEIAQEINKKLCFGGEAVMTRRRSTR